MRHPTKTLTVNKSFKYNFTAKYASNSDRCQRHTTYNYDNEYDGFWFSCQHLQEI